jgi:hypothetical protein
MAANPNATPKEISEVLTAKGMKISPQYVSTIKSGMRTRKKSGKKSVKRAKPGRKAGRSTGDSQGALAHALDYISLSGGIEHAKALLHTVEKKLGSLVR